MFSLSILSTALLVYLILRKKSRWWLKIGFLVNEIGREYNRTKNSSINIFVLLFKFILSII